MWKSGRANTRRICWAALLAAALGADMRPAAGAVHVALAPSDTIVSPGGIVAMRLVISEFGDPFNAYDATIGVPADVTFQAAVPISLQEGSSMTQACGATFHRFAARGDSLVINHVLLCNQQTLSGPGVLYKLTFHAGPVPATARVRLRHVQFYNAGFGIPAVIQDAVVRVRAPTDAGTTAAGRTRLNISPNPCSPVAAIEVDAGGGDRVLRICTPGGTWIRTLESGTRQAGLRRLMWDGRDDRGRVVPSGVYLAVLQTPAAQMTKRIVLLR